MADASAVPAAVGRALAARDRVLLLLDGPAEDGVVAPWLVVLPGLAISLAVIGFNLIGYGLIARIESRRT